MSQLLIAGTRRSSLALAQTRQVVAKLRSLHPELALEIRPVVTEGDRQMGSLREAGRGAFTGSLESALNDGSIDFAVHSLKDLPVKAPEGLMLAAVLDRISARDVVMTPSGSSLVDLGTDCRIGTSSQRRTAQLLAWRPNAQIVPIRGNVDTRVRRMERGEVDALILAEAGLVRLGLSDKRCVPVDLDLMVPAPGQGALAVECRRDDSTVYELIQPLDGPSARRETTAERTFLQALGGSCAWPIGALATWSEPSLTMTAVVHSRDGSQSVRVHGKGKRAQELGQRLAEEALNQGALEMLRHG